MPVILLVSSVLALVSFYYFLCPAKVLVIPASTQPLAAASAPLPAVPRTENPTQALPEAGHEKYHREAASEQLRLLVSASSSFLVCFTSGKQ